MGERSARPNRPPARGLGALAALAALAARLLLLVLVSTPRAQVAGVGPGRADGGAVAVVGGGDEDASRAAHHQDRGDGAALPLLPAALAAVAAEDVIAAPPRGRAPDKEQRRRNGKGRKRQRHGTPGARQDHPHRHHGRKNKNEADERRRVGPRDGKERRQNKDRRKKKNNRTLPGGEAAIRHKHRRSRRKGGRRRKNETAPAPQAVAGAIPAGPAGTASPFRRRSEEKQELVGRRTLQVLSPRGVPTPSSPGLVGILDIPAVKTSAAPAAPAAPTSATTAVLLLADSAPAPTAAPAPLGSAAGLKLGAKPGVRHAAGAAVAALGGRGRTHKQGGEHPVDQDWLQRLLAAAATSSTKAMASAPPAGVEVADLAEPPCERWISCSEHLKPVIWQQLSQLPACPCTFPANVFYYNKIWDANHGRYFRWRDASGRSERLDLYHPGATYCIRSLHSAAAGMLAAQHCCYDRNRQLLTRGFGAGTPSLVSPDVSPALHDTLDVRPWRICKGDFTKYNELRPPNNVNSCPVNPDDAEFRRQAELSQFY